MRRPLVRHTIACVHTCPKRFRHESANPLGFYLPKAAISDGRLNFNPLQGEIERGESAEGAVFREANEEYGIERPEILDVRYLLSTYLPISQTSVKRPHFTHQWIHWHFLSTERRNVIPACDKIERFEWGVGPEQVFDLIQNASFFKLVAFTHALGAALNVAESLRPYEVIASLRN